MIDRLYAPVDLTMTLICTGLASAAFLPGPWLGARLGWTASDKRLDHVAPAQTTISSMAAVILSFPLIPPYGNLRSTQEIIDREASQIDVLDWVLLAVRRGRSKLRPQLWAYAASVLNKEWPAPRDH